MIRKLIKSFFLYTFSFIVAIYLHRGTISLSNNYDIYFGVYIFAWGVSTLISRKFKKDINNSLLDKINTYSISFFLMIGTLALLIYEFNLTKVSRFIVLYSLMLAFLFEVNLLIYKNRDKVKLKYKKLQYSKKAFTLDVILFGIIILYLINNAIGPIKFNLENLVIFVSFYLSWFIGSFVGYQFNPQIRKKNYLTFIWQYIKSYIIILALSAFSAFINQVEPQSIFYIIYGVITYTIISFLIISFYYYAIKYRMYVVNVASFPVKGEFGDIILSEKFKDVDINYNYTSTNSYSELQYSKFKNFSLFKFPELYEFLENNLNLESFQYVNSVILKSDNKSNIDYLPDFKLQLLINLEKINKFRNINEYLIEVNNKLVDRGIFIGNFETSYLRHQRYLKRYPHYFAQLFYIMDFLWNRVLSKVFLFNNIYSAIMNGRSKSFSIAEGLGRLYFCGFEIVNLKIINGSMFFISRKIKKPLKDNKPSTGIIFKMKRIGKHGKPIIIFKLRTMHPYSEYIQDFAYNLNGSENGDKIIDDFRVAFWGKILRKFWFDEIPMIKNVLKGDIKIVGIRPLSYTKFKLYPRDLQKMRISTKPGLIPPFYTDMPNSFNELLESERKYLLAYKQNPILTDIKYFFKCLYNIFIKHARSS